MGRVRWGGWVDGWTMCVEGYCRVRIHTRPAGVAAVVLQVKNSPFPQKKSRP